MEIVWSIAYSEERIVRLSMRTTALIVSTGEELLKRSFLQEVKSAKMRHSSLPNYDLLLHAGPVPFDARARVDVIAFLIALPVNQLYPKVLPSRCAFYFFS